MTALEQLDSELDAYIVGDITYDPEADPVDLGDIDAADRALRRVARIEHDMARLEKLATHRKAQIDEYLANALAPMEREREWFLRSVEGWARAHLSNQKTQTVKLPSGSVSLRKAQPKVEPTVRDPDPDVAPELVRVKREWDRNAVKQATTPGPQIEVDDAPEGYTVHWAVDADGVVVNGITFLVPTQPTCSIKAGHGDD